MTTAPSKFLEKSLDKVVIVKLKSGAEIRGRLKSFDIHMNLILDEAEELNPNSTTKRLGRIIVRGDTVVLISPSGA